MQRETRSLFMPKRNIHKGGVVQWGKGGVCVCLATVWPGVITAPANLAVRKTTVLLMLKGSSWDKNSMYISLP